MTASRTTARPDLSRFILLWVFWPMLGLAVLFEGLALALVADEHPFFSPDAINGIALAFIVAAILAFAAGGIVRRL